MKNIKWSPILVLFPFIITLHTLWRIYICAWTAFSFYVIIGFIAIMLIVLLLDSFLLKKKMQMIQFVSFIPPFDSEHKDF